MKPGDYAGLIALQSNFGTIGVQVDSSGDRYISMTTNGARGDDIVEQNLLEGNLVYLKIEFNFKDSIDIARFYYSVDGSEWIGIGKPLQMKYTLDHFMGYQIGLFNYAMKEIGGDVDFSYFQYLRDNKVVYKYRD